MFDSTRLSIRGRATTVSDLKRVEIRCTVIRMISRRCLPVREKHYTPISETVHRTGQNQIFDYNRIRWISLSERNRSTGVKWVGRCPWLVDVLGWSPPSSVGSPRSGVLSVVLSRWDHAWPRSGYLVTSTVVTRSTGNRYAAQVISQRTSYR